MSRPIFLMWTLVLVSLLAPLAQGQILFDGQTVQGSYLWSTIDTVISGPTTAVVGAGVEFPSTLDSMFNLDISDSNLHATYNYTSGWTGGPFNGFRIFDVNGTIPAFSSVAINGATNMVGFDSSRITFDADNIWVNWQNLDFDLSTVVSLDVNGGGSEVLEPSTMLLMGLGLTGLVVSRRRFKA